MKWNRRAVSILLVGVLALVALAAPVEAASNNRLRGTIAREFSEFGSLTDGAYRNVAGVNYEHLFDDVLGIQVDAFRDLEIADSWQGSLDLTLHFGPLVFQGGGGYDDPSEDFLVNVGGGFDHCSGSYCAQVILRYYRDLNSGDETEGSNLKLGDAYHLSLGIGFGFGW